MILTRPLRLLLIEDDEPTAKALRVFFHQRAGHEVLLAANLAEGRAMLDESPDCVLLDMVLPDGDGADLLEEIRHLDPEQPRVIIVTALPLTSNQVKRAITFRPDAVIQKPYEIADLMAAVKGDKPAVSPVEPQPPR